MKSTIILTSSLSKSIAEYSQLRSEIKVLTSQQDILKQLIIKDHFKMSIGEVVTESGLIVAKYIDVVRADIDRKKLKECYEEVYKDVERVSMYQKLEVM